MKRSSGELGTGDGKGGISITRREITQAATATVISALRAGNQ